MTIKKDLYPTRGELRGNVLTGMLDQALITTRTHSQWDTSGLTGNNTLLIEIDGSTVVPVTFPVQPVLKVEDLIGLINTAFTGVAVVATQVFGGYMRLASPTHGRESLIDVSTSPGLALNLFKFNKVRAIGRQQSEAPPNDGLEDNPPNTKFVATGEPEIQEVVNRPSIALASMLEGVIGQLGTEYAVPQFSTPTATKTMDDLGAPRAIKLASAPAIWPALGSVIRGRDSDVEATLQNIVKEANGDYWFIITDMDPGTFQFNEDITDSGEAITYAIYGNEMRIDDRIRALKMGGPVFVGAKDMFGGSPPTMDHLDKLFQLSIQGRYTVRNAAVKSELAWKEAMLPSYGLEVPLRTSQRARVAQVLSNEPTNLTPTPYDYNGIRRQAPTNIDAWTKSSISPSGGTAAFADKVSEGDIAIITGSPAPGSAHLNNGKYAIRGFNAQDRDLGIYRIGPQRPANSGLDLPEDVLPDAELYECNDTVGAQVEVRSPSYVLNGQKGDAGADRSCWLFLNTPIHEDDVVTVSHYEVMNDPGRRPGIPEMESPWAQRAQGRADEFEGRQANLDLTSFSEGRGVPLSVRKTTEIYSYRWSELLLHAQGRAMLLNSIDANSGGNLDGDSVEPRQPVMMAGMYAAQQPRGFNEPGPVLNMYRRKVKVALQEFDWASLTGTLTPGMALTGATSGAMITVYSPGVQGKNSFLGLVTSGEPELGEDLTGIGVTVSTISHMKFYGFIFELPEVVASQTELLGSIDQNSDVVTWPGPSDPAFLGNIKSGDVLWATSNELSSHKWRARILSATPSPTRQLRLEVVQPYGLDAGPATVDFTWKVTPDIGNYECLQGTGASGTAGTPFITLHEPPIPNPNKESNPHLHGVGPGDILVIQSNEYVVKSLVARQGVISIVEVETSPTNNFSNQAWSFISKHHKTMSTHRDLLKYTGLDEEFYDTAIGAERWVLEGPSYIYIPVHGYGVPHKGGISLSGLNGKSMVLRLLNGVEVVREVTLTFTASPGSVKDLATAINTLLTANDDWVEAILSHGDEPALILQTVAKDTHDNSGGTALPSNGAVGPTITLEVEGEAWNALVYGNPNIQHGNLSEVLWPLGYSESSAHVVTDHEGSYYWNWQWSGAVSMLVPRAEFGADYRKSTNYKRSGVGVLHAHNEFPPVRKNTTFPGAQQGVMLDDVQPTLHLEAGDDYNYHGPQQTALEISTGGRPKIKMTHGGKIFSRIRQHLLETQESADRKDFAGSEGSKPLALYSGPLSIRGSWEGHALHFIITTGSKIYHAHVLFDNTESSVLTIANKIEGTIQGAIGGSWIVCDPDEQGTGIVIRINESALGPNQEPYFNNRFSISIDGSKSTLYELYNNDRRSTELISGDWAGPFRIMTRLRGGGTPAEARGAIAGVVMDRAGGRRLVVPSSLGAQSSGFPTHIQEEVWWEELAGTLQGMLQNNILSGSLDADDLENGISQDESLIFYGGARPGPGSMFLYQFPGFGEGSNFDHGETVVYLDDDEGTSSGYVKDGRRMPAHKPTSWNGYKLAMIREATSDCPHPGGTRFVGQQSGAIGYYNPVLVKFSSYTGGPPGWTVGDNLNCLSNGGASGKYGGDMPLSPPVAGSGYFIIYASDAHFESQSSAQRKKTWAGTIESATHAGFSAHIDEVTFLDSNMIDGGSLKPVMALSYRSFNPHDGLKDKPVITSFGDFQALGDGDYLIHKPLPSDEDVWPSTGSSPTFSRMKAKALIGGGRAVTVERLAEDGNTFHSYKVDGGVQNYILPRHSTGSPGDPGLTSNRTIPLYGSTYRAQLRDRNWAMPYAMTWDAWEVYAPAHLPSRTPRYQAVSFHVPLPEGPVLIEGFGAYVNHIWKDYNGEGEERAPCIVSLWAHGGQDKAGFDRWAGYPGYRHRLEVFNTFDDYIRVDSAGGGDLQVTSHKPSWAKTGYWAPFEPFLINQSNERMVVLYVQDISGSKIPAAGDTIKADTFPDPKNRTSTIAYVEEYGIIGSPSGYKLYITIGPTAIDDVLSNQRGYPRKAFPGSSETDPPSLIDQPWDVFYPGERVYWYDPTTPLNISWGNTVHMDRYPHGMNLRIKVYLSVWSFDEVITIDSVAGVYVRYRCDRHSLSRV